MRRDIVFAPRTSGGLGIQHHGSTILQHKIQNILKHVRAKNDIGKSFTIVLSWCQHQSGFSKPILSSKKKIPHVETKWMRHLWDDLQTIRGTLVFTETWMVLPQRNGDSHIMDRILAADRFSDNQIKTLNLCRLYLCITTVSDIVTSDGTHIMTQFINGTLRNTRSILQWPHKKNQLQVPGNSGRSQLIPSI